MELQTAGCLDATGPSITTTGALRVLAEEAHELIRDTESLVAETRSAVTREDIPGLKQGLALTVEKLAEIRAALAAFRVTEQAFTAVRRAERDRMASAGRDAGAAPPRLHLVADGAKAPSRRRRRGGASPAPAAG